MLNVQVRELSKKLADAVFEAIQKTPLSELVEALPDRKRKASRKRVAAKKADFDSLVASTRKTRKRRKSKKK